MGALSPIVGIAGSLLGGLFGGQPARSTFSGSTSSTNNATGTNTFNYDPAQSALRSSILGGANNLLTSAGPDLGGIQSTMLQNNNAGYGDAQNLLRQTLAARGLTYSPIAAGAESQLQTQRIGGGINIMNQMPLLREQLYQQRLASALNAFRGVPISQTMTQQGSQQGTQQGTQTQTNPGGMLGGLFGNLGQTAPMFSDLFGGGGGNLQGSVNSSNMVSMPPNYNPYDISQNYFGGH